MGRSAKIAIGVVLALAALLGVNALVTGAETKPAEVTVPGGRVVGLQGGALQVVDRGPRDGSPIVLLHGFTAAIDWWDRMMPLLSREHRVVAVDLLGHGGSEKPASGYSMENQADLVAAALAGLGVRDATVVGHSMGGTVAIALAERSPRLVDRVVVSDTRSSTQDEGDLGLLPRLAFAPVIGEALWRIKPDFSVRDALEIGFAPGFEVPDAFVEDVRRVTYSAYHSSSEASEDFTAETSLADRAAATGKPLLVIMGAEEQIIDDPRATLARYASTVPGVRTELIAGAGHSPNVETPAATAALVLGFATRKSAANRADRRRAMQEEMQDRDAVRRHP